MKRSISKTKKYFGFILYGIILTVALLYYRFPSEALREYLEATAGRTIPGFMLSIGKVQPLFPLGVKFLQAELSQKANPSTGLFMADRLWVRPELWSIFRGESKFCFDCGAYKGDLEGCLQFLKQSDNASFVTSIDLKNILIDDYKYLSTLIGRNMQGILTGNITYEGKYNALIEGTGEAELKISDGRVELLEPILSFDSIDFDELLIKMVLKKQKIDLTQVELKGRDIKGTLSGTVKLREDFVNSRLYIRGTLEPFADFSDNGTGGSDTENFLKQSLKKGKFSFVIRGTLTKPRIKFL